MTARRTKLLGAAAGALFVLSVAALVTVPSGASSPSGVVPDGVRVVAQAPVGGARVMVVTERGRLHLLVAYERGDRWHRVDVAPPPARSAAAWAATRGGKGVPALSAVYGRTDGSSVQVAWADGDTDEVKARDDGTFLVARRGHVRSDEVRILAEDGALLSTVDGP